MRCSLLALLLIAFPVAARAFDDASQFFVQAGTPHAATVSASAEGIYFTGAPRFAAQNCQSCHVDAPGQVRLKLGAQPQDLFTVGYQPGAVYQMEVELLGERQGLQYDTPTCTEPGGKGNKLPYVQCNNNSFALEVDTASGPMVSAFCAADPGTSACPAPDARRDEAVVAPGGDAVFANRAHDPILPQTVLHNGASRWHLWWNAPPAGTGPVTFYVAVVDGNGGSGTADNDQDPYGDDTVQGVFALGESGGAPPPSAQVGCSVGGRRAAWLPFGFVLGMLSLGLRSRRRRK